MRDEVSAPMSDTEFDPVHEPDQAIRDLLGLRLIASLGTSNADGSIHLIPIWYLYDQGRLYLPTGSRSRKARNVAARPAVTVLVDQRHGERHRWASAEGTAALLVGAESRQINDRVRERYLTAAGEATYGRLIEAFDDVTIVVTPRRWRHWTPGALERLAEDHGRSVDALADWFHPWD
jgi:PPOX class probable F420-dependent enzyme